MELHSITRPMVDMLCNILRDAGQDKELRCSAAYIFGNLSESRALDALSDVLGRRSDDRDVRQEAIRALGRMGGEKPFEILADVVDRDGDVTMIREEAAEILVQTYKGRAWSVVGPCATDENEELAETVIHMLVNADEPEAIEFLELLFMGAPLSNDPSVPEEAIRKMHELDAERSLPTLLRIVETANEDGALFEAAVGLLKESHPNKLSAALEHSGRAMPDLEE